MFDFLFKKRAANKITANSSATQPLTPQKESIDIARAANQADKHAKKQAALALAASFEGQEEAALAFILQSDLADARLQAVKHIHSPEVLLQVSQAMRNTDRRVSKLVQEKLAELQKQQKMNLAVQACLSQGQRLLSTLPLMVNQVAQWDKDRLALGEYGLSLLQVKVELENRIQEQLELQRQVLQVSTALRLLVTTDLSLEQSQTQLAECILQWQRIQSSIFAPGLPKNQCSQLNDDLILAQAHVQHLVQTSQLAESAVTAPTDFKAAKGEESGDENEHKRKKMRKPAQTAPIHAQFVLAELEQALENGSLQLALDLDKTLRNADIPVRGDIAQRLSILRSELNRLLDWAKWGGNISREELIKSAESLLINTVENKSEDKLAAREIVKQIGGLRARWKELDRTSGATTKLMWERFDEACNQAYQIADAQFKQQAQMRLDNLQIAQAQLAALDDVIADLQNRFPDWKSHQTYINNVRLEWRKKGSVDRSLRAKLESEFEQKIAEVKKPLIAAREASIKVRQQLIHHVTTIAPNRRDAVEKVKQAQQRWQQETLNLPLERNEEQEYWRQFRAACDLVFIQRKANLDEQIQRRNQIILAKQVCCEELEKWVKKCTDQLSDQISAEIVVALRKSKQEWHDLSIQLTEQHRQAGLDARFHAAVNMLEKYYAALLVKNKKAELVKLRRKIELCLQIEEAHESVLLNTVEQSATWMTEWESLATNLLPLDFNKRLTQQLAQRFNNALVALKNQQVINLENAAANVAQLEELLLRIELFRGLASPDELAHQRLQIQMNDLKTAMKDRHVANTYWDNLIALCALPVKFATEQERRFQLILEDYSEYH